MCSAICAMLRPFSHNWMSWSRSYSSLRPSPFALGSFAALCLATASFVMRAGFVTLHLVHFHVSLIGPVALGLGSNQRAAKAPTIKDRHC